VVQRLGENWKQAVVIDNRLGVGGNIETAAAAKAALDRYTLLLSLRYPSTRLIRQQVALRSAKGFCACQHGSHYAAGICI
jgi:tripartite-type tricarboxylate transporter receptor subunit TctC